MDLKAHYDQLYHDSIRKIAQGEHAIDTLIRSPADTRRGMTLLIKPNVDVINNVKIFLQELHDVDGSQYYQPDIDMHITVLSIVSCYTGFKLNDINPRNYIDLINECLPIKEDIHISLEGVTVSLDAVLIQGFLPNQALDELRNTLRKRFGKSTLRQSIDSRYTLSTAHMTVVRFKKPLKNPEKYAKVIEKYRKFSFGEFQTNTLELVYNDWYQSNDIVKKLHTFKTDKQFSG